MDNFGSEALARSSFDQASDNEDDGETQRMIEACGHSADDAVIQDPAQEINADVILCPQKEVCVHSGTPRMDGTAAHLLPAPGRKKPGKQ